MAGAANAALIRAPNNRPMKHLLLPLAFAGLLAGCAQPAQDPWQGVAASRDSSLAAALPMPDAARYETRYFSWDDAGRKRLV